MTWGAVRRLTVLLAILPGAGASADAGLHSAELATALEQHTRVAGLWVAAASASSRLTGADGGIALPIVQNDRSVRYGEADLARKRNISESIGEQGRKLWMAEYQREIGSLVQKLGFRNRFAAQGPDSSYWSPATGSYLVVEAKGGGSRPAMSYGAPQGKNLNTVRSAAYYLSRYPEASLAERIKTAEILEAARRNLLKTGLVRTPHDSGRPGRPALEGPFDSASVAREAERIKSKQIQRHPELRRVYQEASRNIDRLVWQTRLGTALAGFGLVAGVALSWDAYQSWADIARDMREGVVDDTALALRTGSATSLSAWGTAATASSISSLARTLEFGGPWITLGEAAGRYVLPLALATEAFLGASAIYDHYFLHRTSTLEYYAAMSGPVITLTFTVGGAVVGGAIAAFASGGTATAGGVWAGAEVGAMVSIPFVFVNNWLWSLFFEGNLRAVSKGVESAIQELYR